MVPTIIIQQALTILCLQERFTPDNEDFEGIWKRFMKYHDFIKDYNVDGAFYSANYVGEEHVSMDYLVGMLVNNVDPVPERLTLRVIPASKYPVFECTVKELSDTYDWIFKEWLKTTPHKRPRQTSPKADFERYPPATDSGDTMVKLYIALED
jgi:predicted transcriptional regulator YdeE